MKRDAHPRCFINNSCLADRLCYRQPCLITRWLVEELGLFLSSALPVESELPASPLLLLPSSSPPKEAFCEGDRSPKHGEEQRVSWHLQMATGTAWELAAAKTLLVSTSKSQDKTQSAEPRIAADPTIF